MNDSYSINYCESKMPAAILGIVDIRLFSVPHWSRVYFIFLLRKQFKMIVSRTNKPHNKPTRHTYKPQTNSQTNPHIGILDLHISETANEFRKILSNSVFPHPSNPKVKKYCKKNSLFTKAKFCLAWTYSQSLILEQQPKQKGQKWFTRLSAS